MPESNDFHMYNRILDRSPGVLVADPVDVSFDKRIEAAGLRIIKRDKTKSLDDQAHQENGSLIIVRSATEIKAETMNTLAGSIIGIGRGGVGTDNIDTDLARRLGIMVQNTPEASTESVGEHTIALILGLLKNLDSKKMDQGVFGKERTRELRGKQVLIIGAGRIGVDVAAKLHALGCKVNAYDPYNPNVAYVFGSRARGNYGFYIDQKRLGALSEAPHMSIYRGNLSELIYRADIISLHVPGRKITADFQPLLGAKEFSAMKSGALVINTSRASEIDYESLIKTIGEKNLAVGLDVLPEEGETFSKNPHAKRLLQLREAGHAIILTPHTAGNTNEAQGRIAEEMANAVIGIFSGGRIENTVDGYTIGNSRSGDHIRLVIVNRDIPGVIAAVSEAISSLNLHQMNISKSPLHKADKLDVLGWDVEVNGQNPEDISREVVAAIQKLHCDNTLIRGSLIRAMIL